MVFCRQVLGFETIQLFLNLPVAKERPGKHIHIHPWIIESPESDMIVDNPFPVFREHFMDS
jgi:hypothetical protein